MGHGDDAWFDVIGRFRDADEHAVRALDFNEVTRLDTKRIDIGRIHVSRIGAAFFL